MSKHKQLGIMCHLSNKTHPPVCPALQRREEILCLMRSTSDKMMFIVACMTDESNSLSLVPLDEIKYHRSCYKAYTSKRNLQRFVSDVPECGNTSNDASLFTMKTRSKTLPQINWDYCIFVDKRLS
jgi:hypothetical protein